MYLFLETWHTPESCLQEKKLQIIIPLVGLINNYEVDEFQGITKI